MPWPSRLPLGRFLELSVPAPDIADSLDFYRRLGFRELSVNDARPGYYAVVSDGRVTIGLHGSGLEAPALAFVHPELARHVRGLAADGAIFSFTRFGDDQLHEAGLETPEGAGILLVEARTFSPGDLEGPPPLLPGAATAVTIRTRDPAASHSFWTAAGLTAQAEPGDERQQFRGGPLPAALSLVAHPELPWPGPVLRYPEPPGGLRELEARLAARDVAVRRRPEGLVLTAPEGTRLLVGAD